MKQQPKPKTDRGEEVAEILFKGGQYVEQLLATEIQWMTNRLTWLFVSQSFCITAYTILVTSSLTRTGLEPKIAILRIGIPLLGLVCSAFVYFGALAAGKVAQKLADERARITKELNKRCDLKIPLIGVSKGMRDKDLANTLIFGALPQHLPLALIALWVFLLVNGSW
jgi:hypothetical protein